MAKTRELPNARRPLVGEADHGLLSQPVFGRIVDAGEQRLDLGYGEVFHHRGSRVFARHFHLLHDLGVESGLPGAHEGEERVQGGLPLVPRRDAVVPVGFRGGRGTPRPTARRCR